MKNIIVILVVALAFAGCGQSHLITDEAERAAVERDFDERFEAIGNAELFDVFEQELDAQEREALTFLYAYMPLCDIADNTGEFFLDNVRYSFKAREEMPWGATVPEREFRHFVLPPRVNNENLDSCRRVFYEELKPRVKNLTMEEAVLEVNHWCHEKATYTPSDARTSSPLATVRTAYGRCGEESTFTVAALRSVGIPARQVYTPRWAHTDDNHAWVEAWVDGEWYFLGACEPAAVLNLGWFNAPASRGILMHTKVFGRYNGPEEVMKSTERYTEINVIDNYAPTSQLSVAVKDADGKPADSALVEYKVYNYGEFYTVAKKRADSAGRSSLSAGKGDMVVWASKDGKYGFCKASFGKDEVINIVLDKTIADVLSLDLDLVPPAEGANIPEVNAELQAECDRRLAVEDSIRNAYVSTFMTVESASEFARGLGLDAAEVAPLLVGSRGNHATLCEFLKNTQPEKRGDAVRLLQLISDKDLRDVSREVLEDHLTYSYDVANDYILNPRVCDEMIVPYKQFFVEAIPVDEREAFRADPMKLVSWVADNIRIDENCNLIVTPITPRGVWKARVSDAASRDIFFVALARSMGIAARVDEVTRKVQLMTESGAIDIDFNVTEQAAAPSGIIRADFQPTKLYPDPKYYYHFTISKLQDDGSLQLLNYDDGSTWQSLLKDGLRVDVGTYVLVSGTRLASGTVLCHVETFRVEAGRTRTVKLIMRESEDDVQVMGTFNSESRFTTAEGDETSVLLTTGRGYYAIALVGVGEEPTNHALRDIAVVGSELEEWGRSIVVLFPSEEAYKKYKPEEFAGLPSTVTYGIDHSGTIGKQIAENMRLQPGVFPMVIIADTFNRIVFAQQGYTIGLGEQMLKVARQL